MSRYICRPKSGSSSGSIEFENSTIFGVLRVKYFIAGPPKAALLFWFLVILDLVCRYLSLFLLYINKKIGKKRF